MARAILPPTRRNGSCPSPVSYRIYRLIEGAKCYRTSFGAFDADKDCSLTYEAPSRLMMPGDLCEPA